MSPWNVKFLTYKMKRMGWELSEPLAKQEAKKDKGKVGERDREREHMWP